MFYCCTLFFFSQKVISEVNERISFILSHNVQSEYNLIMHPQKLVNLYPHRKITQNPPKNEHFGDRVWHQMANNFETKLHINNRRRHTPWGTVLCQSQKCAWTLTPNEGLVSVDIRHPIVTFGNPLISRKY